MNIAQKAISKISRKITYAKNDIGNLWGGNERLFVDARAFFPLSIRIWAQVSPWMN